MSAATETKGKTEKVVGLFDVVESGFALATNCPWETPFVIFQHLKSGERYAYHTENAYDYLENVGKRYAMVIRVRDHTFCGSKRIWRIAESNLWQQEDGS